jgi:hypothetical protein
MIKNGMNGHVSENNNVSSAYSKRKVFISIFKHSSKRLSIVCKDGAS